MARRRDLVRLFDDDPDLLRHVPAGEREAVRNGTVVESVVLPPGAAEPPAVSSDTLDLGFLVLEGLMLRRVDVFGRRAVELLGDGDLIRTWRDDGEPTLRCRPTWQVVSEVRVAVLDRRFEREAAQWPGVMAELMARLARRPAALATQLAIAQLPRLDMRLLLLFWRLADRWGHVGTDGITVRLRLSQATLGELVAAKRSSVNVALRELREANLLVNSSPGRWLLRGPPPHQWPRDPALSPLPAGSS